jgi:hypothetical protein
MKMPSGIKALPRWDLSSIYPSFDAPEYKRDRELLGEKIAALLKALETPLPEEISAGALLSLIRLYEEAGDMGENLSAYAEAVYTTDTRDGRALAEINALETEALPLGKAAVLDPLQAIRFFFSPLSPWTPPVPGQNPFLRGILPLPLFFESPDGV